MTAASGRSWSGFTAAASIKAAAAPGYDGAGLAEHQDVVVVTLNHRLNVLGYLYLGDVGGPEFEGSANVGQLDLVAALQWVQDNISAFGGDPSRVLIFGQSGGGAKVSTLLAMPSAKGLFHRAVIESGAALRGGEREDANKRAHALLKELGHQPGPGPRPAKSAARQAPCRVKQGDRRRRANRLSARGRRQGLADTSFRPGRDFGLG